MLVKDGAKMTNAVFTPTDGYKDLDEEEVKRLKEEKKSKEKEKEKAEKLAAAVAQRGGGAMRGGRGRLNYG